MIIDHSYSNQAFVDGLKAFLDYTDPNPFQNTPKEGLIIRKCLQKKETERYYIQRWAISELIELIISNPYNPVEETAYQFALKLLRFETDAVDTSVKNVFSIAEHFIEKEVLDLFRSKAGIYP